MSATVEQPPAAALGLPVVILDAVRLTWDGSELAVLGSWDERLAVFDLQFWAFRSKPDERRHFQRQRMEWILGTELTARLWDVEPDEDGYRTLELAV